MVSPPSTTTMRTLSVLVALIVAAAAKPGQTPLGTAPRKVPVVLGVMSGCPDALACEAVFDAALPHVADKIALALTYIAQCVRAIPRAHAADARQAERDRARVRDALHARRAGVRGERPAAVRAGVPRHRPVVAVRAVPERRGPVRGRGRRARAALCARGRAGLGGRAGGPVRGDRAQRRERRGPAAPARERGADARDGHRVRVREARAGTGRSRGRAGRAARS
jgi:hypothetical protein